MSDRVSKLVMSKIGFASPCEVDIMTESINEMVFAAGAKDSTRDFWPQNKCVNAKDQMETLGRVLRCKTMTRIFQHEAMHQQKAKLCQEELRV